MKGNEPNLKKKYKTIIKELMEENGYKSVMQVPKIEKIVVSAGVGDALQNKKLLDAVVNEITQITGQRAVKTKARKSISNFKLRAGYEVGAKVTLRSNQAWEFFDRFVNVSLARVKDFKGIDPNAFDGNGNYSIGIKEQIIFPEINYDKIERINGLNIAVVTTAKTDQEARNFLAKLGMPFRK